MVLSHTHTVLGISFKAQDLLETVLSTGIRSHKYTKNMNRFSLRWLDSSSTREIVCITLMFTWKVLSMYIQLQVTVHSGIDHMTTGGGGYNLIQQQSALHNILLKSNFHLSIFGGIILRITQISMHPLFQH